MGLTLKDFSIRFRLFCLGPLSWLVSENIEVINVVLTEAYASSPYYEGAPVYADQTSFPNLLSIQCATHHILHTFLILKVNHGVTYGITYYILSVGSCLNSFMLFVNSNPLGFSLQIHFVSGH